LKIKKRIHENHSSKQISRGGWRYVQENTIAKPTCSDFWESFLLENSEVLQDIRNEFPYEHLVFGSTSGEISVKCKR
jgi:hypothetical protein